VKRTIASFVLAVSLCSILGCAPLIVVGAAVGALGGYALSKDTIQGETDLSYESLWNSALTVSKIRGTVIVEDYNKGYISLDVKPNKVDIGLIRLTQTTTRVKVTARKYHLPNLDLAQDIYVKILEQAR
jgi:hypothetical protein